MRPSPKRTQRVDSGGMTNAARVWFILQYYGLKAVIPEWRVACPCLGDRAAATDSRGFRAVPGTGPVGLVVPVGSLGKARVGGLGGGIPFFERHTHRTGSMTRIKRRLIAHIEITQRAERRQVADTDKGIGWHCGPLLLSRARQGGEVGGMLDDLGREAKATIRVRRRRHAPQVATIRQEPPT